MVGKRETVTKENLRTRDKVTLSNGKEYTVLVKGKDRVLLRPPSGNIGTPAFNIPWFKDDPSAVNSLSPEDREYFEKHQNHCTWDHFGAIKSITPRFEPRFKFGDKVTTHHSQKTWMIILDLGHKVLVQSYYSGSRVGNWNHEPNFQAALEALDSATRKLVESQDRVGWLDAGSVSISSEQKHLLDKGYTNGNLPPEDLCQPAPPQNCTDVINANQSDFQPTKTHLILYKVARNQITEIVREILIDLLCQEETDDLRISFGKLLASERGSALIQSVAGSLFPHLPWLGDKIQNNQHIMAIADELQTEGMSTFITEVVDRIRHALMPKMNKVQETLLRLEQIENSQENQIEDEEDEESNSLLSAKL